MNLRASREFIVALLFSTSAAHADWQFTRWGMSGDQLRAASQMKIEAAGTDDRKNYYDIVTGGRPEAVSSYNWDGALLKALYLFSHDRLVMVKLITNRHYEALKLVGTIDGIFGPAEQKIETKGACQLTEAFFRDVRRGNLIKYILQTCPDATVALVEYKAIPSLGGL